MAGSFTKIYKHKNLLSYWFVKTVTYTSSNVRLFLKRILGVTFYFFNLNLQLQNVNNGLKFGEQFKLLKEKWRASTVEEKNGNYQCLCYLYSDLLFYYYNTRMLPMVTMCMVDISSML